MQLFSTNVFRINYNVQRSSENVYNSKFLRRMLQLKCTIICTILKLSDLPIFCNKYALCRPASETYHSEKIPAV